MATLGVVVGTMRFPGTREFPCEVLRTVRFVRGSRLVAETGFENVTTIGEADAIGLGPDCAAMLTTEGGTGSGPVATPERNRMLRFGCGLKPGSTIGSS